MGRAAGFVFPPMILPPFRWICNREQTRGIGGVRVRNELLQVRQTVVVPVCCSGPEQVPEIRPFPVIRHAVKIRVGNGCSYFP